jgi:BNR repeat-containing family member
MSRRRVMPRMAMLTLMSATLIVPGLAQDAKAAAPVGDGGWSYFGDPRAIYVNGQTFAGWTSSTGQIQVGAFRNGRKEEVVTVDRAPVENASDGEQPPIVSTLDQFGVDDHSNPSLTTTQDGRIVALYSDHARDLDRRDRLYYRVSNRPYDASSWGPVRQVPRTDRIKGKRGIAYPNPVRMNDGRTFVFWRGRDWFPNLAATRDFKSWSTPRSIIRGPRGQRPYAKYVGAGNGAYVAYTNAHPNSKPTSIYCLFIRSDGVIARLDGRKVGTTSRPPKYSQGTVVYRYRPDLGRSWVQDIALDGGKPVILYFRREQGTRNMYRLARWDGRRWIDRPIVEAGGTRGDPWYVAGATLDHETPNVVYLARRNGPGAVAEVERWVTPDAGRTWSSIALTSGSTHDNWRPVSPRGLTGDTTQVWWFGGYYQNYREFTTKVFAAFGVPTAGVNR